MKAIYLLAISMIMSANAALASDGCTGTRKEIAAQREEIQSDLLKEAPDLNISNFKSAAALTKAGARHVYSYTITEDGKSYPLAGTSLFGGSDCSLQESFASVVR